MEEELLKNKEDDELFMEFLLVNGFKMVATKNISSIQGNKPAILLQTENKQLFKDLKKWAWKNDVVILYNPLQHDFEISKRLYAFVIDSDFVSNFPFPELLNGKYIKAEMEFDLLEDILTNFKML